MSSWWVSRTCAMPPRASAESTTSGPVGGVDQQPARGTRNEPGVRSERPAIVVATQEDAGSHLPGKTPVGSASRPGCRSTASDTRARRATSDALPRPLPVDGSPPTGHPRAPRSVRALEPCHVAVDAAGVDIPRSGDVLGVAFVSAGHHGTLLGRLMHSQSCRQLPPARAARAGCVCLVA
jgi:hypothetical protein